MPESQAKANLGRFAITKRGRQPREKNRLEVVPGSVSADGEIKRPVNGRLDFQKFGWSRKRFTANFHHTK